MSKNNEMDKLVLELLAKVKEKKKEIAAAERPKWETNLTIGFNPDNVSDRMNIQTVTDIGKLVDLYAFLMGKEDGWAHANKELEIRGVEMRYMGSSIQSWKNDIKLRIQQLDISNKRRELEKLESRLDGLMTTEQKRAIALEEIQNLLK